MPATARLSCICALVHLAAASWPGSQGDQDDRLQDLFYGKIGVTNRYYVEFGGACGVPGSNTFRLRRNRASLILPQYRSQHVAWKGFMMDGEACNLRKPEFDKYGVPHIRNKDLRKPGDWDCFR